MGVRPLSSSRSLFLITDPHYRKCSCPIHYKQVNEKHECCYSNTLFGQERRERFQTPGPLNLPHVFCLSTFPPPRSEQEKNIRDPVLTHHNVTPTHGMRELLPGSLSVSLCNQSRRHCPKSRGVTFCCGAEFKAERHTGRPATLPELEREIRARTATFYSLKKGLSKACSVCRPCPFMLAAA